MGKLRSSVIGWAAVFLGVLASGQHVLAHGCPSVGDGRQKEQTETARDCQPLFEAGKSWKYKVSDLSHPDKDEILEIYAVKEKVFRYGRDCWHIIKTDGDSQHVVKDYFCYEDNGRVFWYDEGFGGWALIFDYNLNRGDNVLESNRYVHAKDRIRVAGIERNRLCIGTGEPDGYWIEGIGAKGGLYMTSFAVSGCPSADYTLIECSLDGEVLFTEHDFSSETYGNADRFNNVEDASGYVSLFDIGKKWEYEKTEHDSSTGLDRVTTFSVDVAGRDIIGEQECWRLHRSCRETGEESDMLVRQEAGRIYLYNPLTEGFALIMDFSYGEDYIVLEESHVIDRSDVMEIDGKDRKRLKISLMRTKTVDYWVESVGSRDFSFLTYVSDVTAKFRMIECSQDGKKLLGYEDFDSSSGSVSLVDDDEYKDNYVYDISGRAACFPQKGKVYIEGGRKVVY